MSDFWVRSCAIFVIYLLLMLLWNIAALPMIRQAGKAWRDE